MDNRRKPVNRRLSVAERERRTRDAVSHGAQVPTQGGSASGRVATVPPVAVDAPTPPAGEPTVVEVPGVHPGVVVMPDTDAHAALVAAGERVERAREAARLAGAARLRVQRQLEEHQERLAGLKRSTVAASATTAAVSAAAAAPTARPRIESAPPARPVVPPAVDPAVEVARIEAARVEALRIEQARVEEARVDAARLEARRVEEARVEEARVEALRVEEARVEAARLEAVRVEEARVEAARVEEARLEAARFEEARVEEARVEEARRASRAEAARAEAARADAARREAARIAAAQAAIVTRVPSTPATTAVNLTKPPAAPEVAPAVTLAKPARPVAPAARSAAPVAVPAARPTTPSRPAPSRPASAPRTPVPARSAGAAALAAVAASTPSAPPRTPAAPPADATPEKERRRRRLLLPLFLVVVLAAVVVLGVVRLGGSPSDAPAGGGPVAANVPAEGSLAVTADLGDTDIDVTETTTLGQDRPDALTLSLPDLVGAGTLAASADIEVQDLTVSLDGESVAVEQDPGFPGRWTVPVAAGTTPSTLEVSYRLTGAIVQSDLSAPGRRLAVLGPLSSSLSTGTSSVDVTGEGVLNVFCPGLSADQLLCATQSGDDWQASLPQPSASAVLVQIDRG